MEDSMISLIMKANQGDAEAQYKLFLYYRDSNKQEDWQKAYKYCTMAVDNGHADATYQLGLMYAEGNTPVWDAITAEWLLDVAANAGVPNAKQTHDKVKSHIDEFRPCAKINPSLPVNKVPAIAGVKESLERFLDMLQKHDDVKGALCGRLGSISNYPMIELARSCEFKSVVGDNFMETPSAGFCLIVNFAMLTANPCKASAEEAFWHMRFKELEFFEQFICHKSFNVTNRANTAIVDIWQYTLDCGDDVDKAVRIASSILYHLYGYKKSYIHPPITLDVAIQGCTFKPANDSVDYVGIFFYNIEQFGWPDAALMALCCVLSFWLGKDIEGSIILAAFSSLAAFTYGSTLTSYVKKARFPKRNYIRFFRDPSTEY